MSVPHDRGHKPFALLGKAEGRVVTMECLSDVPPEAVNSPAFVV